MAGVAFHLVRACSDRGFRRLTKLHGEDIARSRVGSFGHHPFQNARCGVRRRPRRDDVNLGSQGREKLGARRVDGAVVVDDVDVDGAHRLGDRLFHVLPLGMANVRDAGEIASGVIGERAVAKTKREATDVLGRVVFLGERRERWELLSSLVTSARPVLAVRG